MIFCVGALNFTTSGVNDQYDRATADHQAALRARFKAHIPNWALLKVKKYPAEKSLPLRKMIFSNFTLYFILKLKFKIKIISRQNTLVRIIVTYPFQLRSPTESPLASLFLFSRLSFSFFLISIRKNIFLLKSKFSSFSESLFSLSPRVGWHQCVIHDVIEKFRPISKRLTSRCARNKSRN